MLVRRKKGDSCQDTLHLILSVGDYENFYLTSKKGEAGPANKSWSARIGPTRENQVWNLPQECLEADKPHLNTS